MAKKIVTWYLVFLGFAMAFVPRVDIFCPFKRERGRLSRQGA